LPAPASCGRLAQLACVCTGKMGCGRMKCVTRSMCGSSGR
jgi:hypothetical protein